MNYYSVRVWRMGDWYIFKGDEKSLLKMIDKYLLEDVIIENSLIGKKVVMDREDSNLGKVNFKETDCFGCGLVIF